MDYKALGQRVRELRKSMKLSQEKLAELCNISSTYIGVIERGEKKLSVDALVRIANVLDVSLDFLLVDSLAKKEDSSFNRATTILKSLSSEVDINFISDWMELFQSYTKPK